MTRAAETKLSVYQKVVVLQWIDNAKSAGDDREDAICRALNALEDRQEQAVRELFNKMWPAQVSK